MSMFTFDPGRRLGASLLIGAVAVASAASTEHAQSANPAPPIVLAFSGGDTCPAVFQRPAARRIAIELVKRLTPQVSSLGAVKTVDLIGKELVSGLRRELSPSDYRANQGTITEMDRDRVALCFPRLSALLDQMDQQGTDTSRFDVERQHRQEQEATARSQAEAAAGQAALVEQQRQAEIRRQRQAEADAEADRRAAEQQARADAARQRRDAAAKALQEDQAKAREQFFANSVKVPDPAAVPKGEKNPWAEAFKQLTTRPADADQPGGQLVSAYRGYIFVRKCFDSRTGYALIYVTPEELEDAKSQMKSIEDALLQQDATIDKDERWATANRLSEEIANNLIVRMDPGQQAVARREYTEEGRRICRSSLASLRESYEAINPDAKKVTKDF